MDKIRLTIDGREVEVDAGVTVLAAARRLGIRIPTLCHLPELPPRPSCFMCVVEVNGSPVLQPACALPAAADMRVLTVTPAVLAARRRALELLLSDHVGECEAPCSLACPAGLDIPRLLAAVRDGAGAAAIELVMRRIPLAGSLGRICPAYCERPCRRRQVDEPLAVCLLKRFAWDQYAGEYRPALPAPGLGRVAVVGAGPAGLTAAFFLRLAGALPVVFDAEPLAGGLLRQLLPPSRLPDAVVAAEIALIANLGAEFRLGRRVDEPAALANEFAAVVLATGAAAAPAPAWPGAGFAESAKSLLQAARAGGGAGRRPALGATVVLGDGQEALETACLLHRQGSAETVLLTTLAEPRLNAHSALLAAALAAGVRLEFQAVPVQLEKLPDGKLRLQYTVAEVARELVADQVFHAAARLARRDWLDAAGLAGAEARRGWLWDGGRVFAAGEAVAGPGYTVHAVAAGRTVANAVTAVLMGAAPDMVKDYNHPLGKLGDTETAAYYRGVPSRPRLRPGVAAESAAGPRLAAFAESATGFTQEQAAAEAARCLACDCAGKAKCELRNLAAEYAAAPRLLRGERREFAVDKSHPDIVYESGKCILCGRCVGLAEQRGEGAGLAFLKRGFETRVAPPLGLGLDAACSRDTALLCAASCPTGALTVTPKFAESANLL